jgi:integrase
MSLVYKHGQRHNYVPRQQEGNPMNWVSQRTTSDYRALIMTPKQAFEVLLNIPEPRRTLNLSDAATALRVSELLGLMWMDLDFEESVMYVRRAYVWGRFKVPKSKASKAAVPMHPLLAGFMLAWREQDASSAVAFGHASRSEATSKSPTAPYIVGRDSHRNLLNSIRGDRCETPVTESHPALPKRCRERHDRRLRARSSTDQDPTVALPSDDALERGRIVNACSR